ncbi:MAG: hypothetical protein RJA59_1972, partial [Pseudomonadota bacterium]
FTSADGSLEGSIGTFERQAGDRKVTGLFLVVRVRRGDALRTLLDSEMPSG